MYRIIVFTALLVAISETATLNQGRIVGGREVTIAKHPHQVSIRRKTCESCAFLHECGGVIVNDLWILTAAHCVHKRLESSIVVVAGTDNRSGADGVIVHVDKIVIHENYNPGLSENDIALIYLSSSLPINQVTIRPVKFASQVPKSGAFAVVTGWGATSEGGANSLKLQEVDVHIIDSNICDAAYGFNRISDDMLCAGTSAGGKDACQNDSGGPLLSNNELVGIVSWGSGCARPEYPGVYANVFYFQKWIQSNIQ